MKILNLFAGGAGGNRNLWNEYHEITAVEMNPVHVEIYKYLYPNDVMIAGEDAFEYVIKNYKNFDFIWASPPCPTHSWSNNFLEAQGNMKEIPDMRLYGLIIFLAKFASKNKILWVVENVKPYYIDWLIKNVEEEYKPLIRPTFKYGRHYYWSNIKIKSKIFSAPNITNGKKSTRMSNQKYLKMLEKYNNIIIPDQIEDLKIGTERKIQILRDCVRPIEGKHIFDNMINESLGLKKFIK